MSFGVFIRVFGILMKGKRMLRRVILGLSIVALMGLNADGADWTRFRGPNGSGVSDSPAPVKFGADENMKWKLKLPGRGVSSPIIVGDKVFVTCWSGYGGDLGRELDDLKRHLVCVDRKTGKTTWEKAIAATQPEDPWSGMGVPAHGYASHTPASDGERVFCFFGKGGVVAFDLNGEKLWQVNVGKESGRMRWGSAASPILYKDTLVVNASDEAEAIVGLDVKTGKEKWKAQAGGIASTWGTPALVKTEKGTEIVMAVPGEVWGFNADNGKLRWYAVGNEGASHSVIVDQDIVYSIGGGRGGSNGVAIKAGGKGEIKETDLVWENRAGGRFATPILFSGNLYTVNGNIVACYGAADGKKVFEKRLPESSGAQPAAGGGGERERGGRGGFGGGRGGRGGRGGADYASPIIAGEKLYITRSSGTVHVLEARNEYKLLATNDLSFDSSGFNGTPAAGDGELFIRSNTHLYCFGE